MSKKLIAGAGVVASFAIALAPLATFAVDAESDQHTDRLNITVQPACSFGSAADSEHVDVGVSHAAGSAQTDADATTVGSWDTTDSDGTGRVPDNSTSGVNANKSDDTFTYSIYAGTKKDAMATTTLKVFCNDNSGYMIKAITNPLTEVTEAETKQSIAAQAYTTATSGYGITAVTSTPMTTATATAAAPFTAANATNIAWKQTAGDAAGDSVTMTYGLGVAPGQKAATYEGTVVYTLIHPYANS